MDDQNSITQNDNNLPSQSNTVSNNNTTLPAQLDNHVQPLPQTTPSNMPETSTPNQPSSPANLNSIYPNPDNPNNPIAAETSPIEPKKSNKIKSLIIWFLVIIILGAVGYCGYYYLFPNFGFQSKIITLAPIPNNFISGELPSKKMSFKFPPNIHSDPNSSWSTKCQELTDVVDYSNSKELLEYSSGVKSVKSQGKEAIKNYLLNSPDAITITATRWDDKNKECTSRYSTLTDRSTPIFDSTSHIIKSISSDTKVVSQENTKFHHENAQITQLSAGDKNSFLVLNFSHSGDFYSLILHTSSNKLNIDEQKKLFGQVLSSIKLK